MAGPRQPIAVVEARGNKHLTKAEKARRESEEPVLAAPEKGEGSKIRAPKWLPEELRGQFNDLRAQLVSAGIFSALDRDTLGRYLVAREQWNMATGETRKYLEKRDVEGAEAWSRIQERYFKQCRACAMDLGLTISARCRLVVPEALRPKEDPEEAAFLELLERRRRA